MEILEFVRLAEVDPVYFEASYYAHPEEPGEQAYALLYEAMRQTGLVGLARLAMHRREHIVILRPGRSGILAHTMYFEGEVRSDQEYRADTASLNPRNLQLAKMLTESLAARFEPAKYRDTYREKLEALIAAKRRGEPAAVAPSPEPARRVVDITDALRKSIAATKKPAAVSQPRRPPKPRRRA
jgi:DNA end-binding protein Ku